MVYGRDPLLDGKKARQEIPPDVSNNCYVTEGIVGASDNCSFNGVHTSGSVNGSKIICGIAGQALNSNFYNCANLGSLYGGSRVGGIVGEAKGVTIKNCYETVLC